MVEVCVVFCYCLLWLDARDNRCIYMAHVCLYVCCCNYVGVGGNARRVAAVVKDSCFSLGVLKYVVCLRRGCN